MLEKIGGFFAEKVKRWLPDSLVFAFILTILAAILVFILTPTKPVELVHHWYKGFWIMLEFAMQMALILTFGYCIGISKPVAWLFDKIAGLISTPVVAYLTISLVSIGLMLINWGLAPVAGLFALEVSRRVRNVDYRIACAAVYSGLLPWHGGFSASAPLLMNTPNNQFIKSGVIDHVIPTSATLGSTLNIVLIIATVIVVPLFILLVAPGRAKKEFDTSALADASSACDDTAAQKPEEPLERQERAPADIMETSWILTLIIVIAGGTYIIPHFAKTGINGLNLNTVNFFFLMVGLLLHGTPRNYINAMKQAVRGVGDILLQFPFYAGIMGIFMFSGLSAIIAEWFASFATATTFPFFAFLSSAIVNLFVPSGGGEWIVLAPTIIPASHEIGASLEKVIICFGYGDALTNLINPFWTLTFIPIMSKLMDIRPRDFMGYTVLLCILFFIVITLAIFLVPA